MSRAALVLALLLGGVSMLSAMSNVAAAADPVMGNWDGTWRNDNGDEGKLEAQVVALGKDKYQANFTAYYDGKQAIFKVTVDGTRKEGKVLFSGKADLGPDAGGVFDWTGEVLEEKSTGEYKGKEDVGRFSLKRVQKKPATLGAKPPEGAIVLFDGKAPAPLSAWLRRKGGKAGWKIAGDAMEVVAGTGDILTQQTFGDHKLHLEFRTPFMPEARGQGRGNSGVYIQGRYEVQVLDSFGLEPKDNECGGLYSQYAPKVNACLPPEEWQTYDITFRAARVEGGKVVKPARISVVHNGVTIHDNVELKGLTGGALDEKEGTPGPLLLQDHGNPVQYRNIWWVPLKGE